MRTTMYYSLVVAMVAVLWVYAAQLSSSSRPSILKSDYPIAIAHMETITGLAPWSAGDVDSARTDNAAS